MMGKCYNCGGIGHPARLCPTKGQGKGKGNGKGESFGKGGPKGGGKGGGAYHPANQTYNPKGMGKGGAPFGNQATKGGGKGYQGTCWTCGMVGHKSAECRTRRTNLVEAEEGEAETNTREIGGVWIMNVNKVKTKNRFQALTRDEDDDQGDGEGQGEREDQARDVKTNRVTGRQWTKMKLSPKTNLISTSNAPTGNRSPNHPKVLSPITHQVKPPVTRPSPVCKESEATDNGSEWKVQKPRRRK